MQLVDGDNPSRISRTHNIACVNQPGAGAAIDRRSNPAVVQLVLGHIDDGLVGLDACFKLTDRCLGSLELLSTAGAAGGELPGAVEVKASFDQLRLILEL